VTRNDDADDVIVVDDDDDDDDNNNNNNSDTFVRISALKWHHSCQSCVGCVNKPSVGWVSGGCLFNYVIRKDSLPWFLI
jgi:hypothetical protein